MFAHDQLRSPLGFSREMARHATRESSDPIAATDRGMGFEMEQIDSFANGEVADARFSFEDQTFRKNPAPANPAAWMDLIAELLL